MNYITKQIRKFRSIEGKTNQIILDDFQAPSKTNTNWTISSMREDERKRMYRAMNSTAHKINTDSFGRKINVDRHSRILKD